MLHRTVQKRFGVDGAAFGERSHGVGGSGDGLDSGEALQPARHAVDRRKRQDCEDQQAWSCQLRSGRATAARCPPEPSSSTLTRASVSPKDSLTPSTSIMAPEVVQVVLVVTRTFRSRSRVLPAWD